MRREPPKEDFIRERDFIACPIDGCYAEGISVEPDCSHEYPGRCAACDTIVGNRYADLAWMGTKLGAEQWLCERCRSYCEECDEDGKITFDGVCGSCCRVKAADGTVLHSGKEPAVELVLGGTWPRWRRLG